MGWTDRWEKCPVKLLLYDNSALHGLRRGDRLREGSGLDYTNALKFFCRDAIRRPGARVLGETARQGRSMRSSPAQIFGIPGQPKLVGGARWSWRQG